MESTPLSHQSPNWLQESNEFEISSAELTTEPDWVKEDNNSKLDECKSNPEKVKASGRVGRKPRRSKSKGNKKESDSTALPAEYEEDCCCIPIEMIDPLLWWIWLFRLICMCLLIACMIANISYITTTRGASSITNSDSSDIREYCLHFYALFFCIAGISAEMELSCTKHYCRILQQWFFRGLLYAFVGVLTSSFKIGSSSAAVLYQPTWSNVVSFLLCVTGALYSIMGLLCVKSRLAKSQHSYSEIPNIPSMDVV